MSSTHERHWKLLLNLPKRGMKWRHSGRDQEHVASSATARLSLLNANLWQVSASPDDFSCAERLRGRPRYLVGVYQVLHDDVYVDKDQSDTKRAMDQHAYTHIIVGRVAAGKLNTVRHMQHTRGLFEILDIQEKTHSSCLGALEK